MSHEEQYIRLLKREREKELLSFLRSLTVQEKKAIAPIVKSLAKEYLTYQQVGTTWKYKGTDMQRTLLNYTFFACYDYKEIKKENPAWLISREHLEKFLSWYCPSWLNDYINSFGESEWLPFALDYGYLMELTSKGFIHPAPRLIARMLSPYIYEQKDRKHFFRPERLEEFEVTLKEHFWFLFQYETSIHYSTRYLYSDGKPVENGWIDVCRIFVEKGKIDKHQLLKEALLASHRNFNKNLSGWFAELFIQSNPSKEETLLLQPEIINSFSSPHSKVVGAAIQSCKLIADCDTFNVTSFLDSASLLLSNGTKSIVTSTLQVLEKIAKKNKEKRSTICLVVTGTFIHKDEGLQSRAAKLIEKFGDTHENELAESIALNKDNLFSNAKTILQPFFRLENDLFQLNTPSNLEPELQKCHLSNATALPIIHNIDELVFLSSQAFDNNESWHIDLLPAALIRLQHEIKGEHLAKLEPAIQRALKLYFGDWRSTQGELDLLLACFFLDYCLWLIEQFPDEGRTAHGLFTTFMSKTEENKKVWQEHGTSTSFLGGWKPEGRRLIYSAYWKLLEAILYGLKNRISLPVLSEPTHSPARIDPEVLVERLANHQQDIDRIDDTDLQIALSRCWLYDTDRAIKLAEKKLQGEIKSIMLFLLNQKQEPIGPFTKESAWMVAALSKSPETLYPALAGLALSTMPRYHYSGQYPYKILVETYIQDAYQWENGKYLNSKKSAQREVINIEFRSNEPPKPTPLSGLKKFFKKLTGKEEIAEPGLAPLIYDYIRFNEQWMSIEDRDIRRLYLLTPNNPEPLLARIIDKCLSNPQFSDATRGRIVVETLQVLHETWKQPGEMGHLFISTCMLSQDKTTANYAAEIWVKAVEENSINNDLLGTLLGKTQSIEFAPMKRLTDLILKNMLNISPLHNTALQAMLTAFLREQPESPIRGFRKLLEIYFELLHVNCSSVLDASLNSKMQHWKGSGTLSKVIKDVIVQ